METYKERGGARFGLNAILQVNATWPFATLRADQDKIRLGVLFLGWTIPKENLVGLYRHSGFFSTGLRIEHNVKWAPSFLVFWSSNFSDLAAALRRLGYTII